MKARLPTSCQNIRLPLLQPPAHPSPWQRSGPPSHIPEVTGPGEHTPGVRAGHSQTSLVSTRGATLAPCCEVVKVTSNPGCPGRQEPSQRGLACV